MVARRLACAVVVLAACAHHHPGNGDDSDANPTIVPDACEGLRCFQADCEAKNLPPTTISGTVFAPNGTLPLFGVNVYVPETDPGPLVDGAVCARCDEGLQGGALTQAITDEAGHFELTNVPATMNVPIVIQVGKWRRQLTIPNVAACQTLPMDAVDSTLPKSMTDMTANTTSVDMPRIAISTGGADALECLVRKLGIADKEITAAGQGGRINLFSDFSAAGKGVGSFKVGFGGGTGAFGDSQNLWNPTTPFTGGVAKLASYDIVFLSCEGAQYPATKPQNSLQAMSDYADLGGRVFMSHWHNIWISGEQGHQATHGIPSWEATSTWTFAGNPSPDTLTATIDEAGNPKGVSFAKWMDNVGGSVTHDLITPVDQARNTASGVNGDTERWVYLDPATSPNVAGAMNFQFTTPQAADPAQRCGKVVFSDMHVSADSTSAAGNPYPGGCSTQPLTPQEKALAFMFFDIASCVGSIF
ncbi:MAG TPA: hypothetical protein VFQ65_26880 [Kofleriaceae bacterium]|nr:hypothetical protein [Kofleriaceae bacterium]